MTRCDPVGGFLRALWAAVQAHGTPDRREDRRGAEMTWLADPKTCRLVVGLAALIIVTLFGVVLALYVLARGVS